MLEGEHPLAERGTDPRLERGEPLRPGGVGQVHHLDGRNGSHQPGEPVVVGCVAGSGVDAPHDDDPFEGEGVVNVSHSVKYRFAGRDAAGSPLDSAGACR